MYVVHTAPTVELPYLPDPLSHGVTFMPLDGSNGAAHRAFAGSAWPDAAPFKLILSGGPTALDMSGPDASVLLEQGTMLSVRYASAAVPPNGSGNGPPQGELEQMGRWHGMGATGQAATQTHHFQHWMLTPWRTFTFVHAVEKPLTQPEIKLLTVSKGKGNTFVQIAQGKGEAHAPSTGELELRGRWQDMVDDPAGTEPEDDPHPVSKDSHVWDRKVDYDENQFDFTKRGEGPKHEFGDTKHRFVHYRFIGTTRYREYFPPKLTDYETVETHPGDPDLTQKKKLITRPGPEFLVNSLPVNILSSARPSQPDMLYVLPTFKWVDTANGRKRQGRGLRIYMRRGWFSSGVGELLGVVMMPQGPVSSEVAEELRKYVSQWGNDPIFDRNLNTPLTASQFTHDPAFPDTMPRHLGQGLLLAEGEKGQLPLFTQVLGFYPNFDYERKLWYVDLELLPTSHYYTFLRLGLCRYQPQSLPSCEISKVVHTEFAQLLADRSATLNHRTGFIDVTLAGPSGLSKLGQSLATGGAGNAPGNPPGRGGPGGNVALPGVITPNPNAGRAHRVVAQIESLPPGASDDLGWQTVQTVELASHTSALSPGIVYFTGSVRWPQRNLPANHQYRLALREYEIYLTDHDVADDGASTVANRTRSRLVYADVFPLGDRGSITTVARFADRLVSAGSRDERIRSRKRSTATPPRPPEEFRASGAISTQNHLVAAFGTRRFHGIDALAPKRTVAARRMANGAKSWTVSVRAHRQATLSEWLPKKQMNSDLRWRKRFPLAAENRIGRRASVRGARRSSWPIRAGCTTPYSEERRRRRRRGGCAASQAASHAISSSARSPLSLRA